MPNEKEELLDLELEENDAVERQHKMDSINSLMDPKKLASFADVSDDDESDGKFNNTGSFNGVSEFLDLKRGTKGIFH
jgi:hypothetical protein